MKNKNRKLMILVIGLFTLMIMSSFSTNSKALEKPNSFNLSDNAGSVERDGKVNLNWQISLYAKDYILYEHNEEITESNLEDAKKVQEFGYRVLSTSLSFDKNDNGTYYYVIVAENSAGITLSNNIHFRVAVPPLPETFTLTISEKSIKTTDLVTLNWTRSSYAESYLIYKSSVQINNTNDLKYARKLDETSELSYQYFENEGEIYYTILAKNPKGSQISNSERIDITKPSAFIFNPVLWFSQMDSIGKFLMILNLIVSSGGFLGFRLYTLQKRPIINVNSSKNYGDTKLGRLVSCESSRKDGFNLYWKYKFKKLSKNEELQIDGEKIDSYKDYTAVYSLHNFEMMRIHKFKTLNIGFWRWEFYPHYFVEKKQLPPKLWIQEEQLKQTGKNKARYYFWRFLNLLPLLPLSISEKMHDTIEYEYTGNVIKEIYVLQLEYQQERKSFEYLTEFEEKEYFESGDCYYWVKNPQLELVSIVLDGNEFRCERIEEYKSLMQEVLSMKKLKREDNEEFNEKEFEDLLEAVNKFTDRYKIDLEVVNLYALVKRHLRNMREEQEELLDNELIDEQDTKYFFTLFQIDDLKNYPMKYRKIQTKGDPIPKIRTIKDLNEAIRNAEDRRELLSDLTLKLEAKDKRIRKLEKSYQNEREKVRDFDLEFESRVEEKILEYEQERGKRVNNKIQFTKRVVEKVEYGMDIEEAFKTTLKQEYENQRRENIEKEMMIDQMRRQQQMINQMNQSRREEEDGIRVQFPQKRPKISSLEDLKDLGNGGK